MKYLCIYHDAYAAKGTFPQVEGLQKGYSVESPKSIANISKYRGVEIDSVEIFLELSKGATFTDILSTFYFSERTGLLISKKLLNLLSEFSLPPHQVFAASVKSGNILAEYYYIHFTSDLSSYVNFSQSPLRYLDPQKNINKIISVQDKNEYQQLSKSKGILATINMTEVKLLEHKYDVINLPYLFTGLLISQPLFNEMKKSEISGFSIYPLEAASA